MKSIVKPQRLPVIGLVAGLLGALLAYPAPEPVSGNAGDPPGWRLPELPDRSGVNQTARRIVDRQPWGGASRPVGEDGQSQSQELAQKQADDEAAALDRAAREARRLAAQWRFVGSTEQQGTLLAVFRSGDDRTRRLFAGEALERGARLVELGADRAVLEIPAELARQGETTESVVRLRLFRDTEFSLHVPEQEGNPPVQNPEANSPQAGNPQAGNPKAGNPEPP